MGRDYRQEYLDFQSSRSSKKKRAELNRINHKNNTYGNGDGIDVSHQSDGSTTSESSSKNKSRDEKSRKKGSKRKPFRFWSRKKAEQGILLSPEYTKKKNSRIKAQFGLSLSPNSVTKKIIQAGSNIYNWKENLSENIDPYGYGDNPLNRLYKAVVLDKPEAGRDEMEFINKGAGPDSEKQKRDLRYGESERQDLLSMSLGQTPKHGVIKESLYRPANSTDSDATYYQSPATDAAIRDSMNVSNSDQNFVQKDFKSYLSGDSDEPHLQKGGLGSVLGNFTIDKGQDENGYYISYYDKWDLNPLTSKKGPLRTLSDKVQSVVGVSTPEIYGRIYYDPKTGKPIEQKKEQKLGGKKNSSKYNLRRGGVRVKAQKGLPVFMGSFPEEKKEIMTKSMLEDYLSKTRGQTSEFWKQTGDTIAYHESGHSQRMSPTARQITNNNEKDGVGRGMFMFETKDDKGKDGFETAQKRYSNIAKSKNLGEDLEIMNAKSADELSEDQQYALFYSDLIEGPAKLSDYAKGKMSIEDLWIKGHKKKEVPGDRESFEESRKDSEEGLKKYGLRKGGLVRRKAQKGVKKFPYGRPAVRKLRSSLGLKGMTKKQRERYNDNRNAIIAHNKKLSEERALEEERNRIPEGQTVMSIKPS